MGAADQHAEESGEPPRPEVPARAPGYRERLRAAAHVLAALWARLNDDWIFSLAAMLAYNLLASIFPILLVIIAVVGFALGRISPAAKEALVAGIVGQLPPGVGRPVVDAVVDNLGRNAGLALAFGILSALFFGSRLFVTIEGCFGVIYRLPPRDPVRQNVMAFAMMLLYLVLLPLVFLVGTLVDLLAAVIYHGRTAPLAAQIHLLGIVATLISAALLFGAIYVVVPNRPIRWRDAWKGTLVAAALLVLYQQLFPLYQAYFLTPTNPGAVIGLVLVIVVFFYYIAFILLLGAEVNAWTAAPRAIRRRLATLLRGDPAH